MMQVSRWLGMTACASVFIAWIGGHAAPRGQTQDVENPCGRCLAALAEFQSGPTTITTTLRMKGFPLVPVDAPRGNLLISADILLTQSGPFWRMEIDFTRIHSNGVERKSRWQSFWDGNHYYRVFEEPTRTVCQVREAPPTGRIIHDMFAIMNRHVGGTIFGSGPLAEGFRDGEVIDQTTNSDASKCLLAIHAPSPYRVYLEVDDRREGRVRVLEKRGDVSGAEPGWQEGGTVWTYRIIEWTVVDGISLPKTLYRETEVEAASKKEDRTRGLVTLERLGEPALSDDQLPASDFRPSFDRGWRVFDYAAHVLYTIGACEVQIDDVWYRTTEPMHPDRITSLPTIVRQKLAGESHDDR